MKKLIITLSILMVLTGCTYNSVSQSEKEYYDAYSLINTSDIESYVSNFEIDGDISDPSYVNELSTDIALITITSIDGGSNFSEQTNEYCYPYTYGTFEVVDVYKGSMNVGDNLSYIRAGGIIDYVSYYNSLTQSEKEKSDYLSKGKNPAYIEMKFNDDIDIEVGKTYLAYLCNPQSGIGVYAKKDAYMITSFQGGLREVDITSSVSDDSSQIKVLNNFTGEWESLDSLINK